MPIKVICLLDTLCSSCPQILMSATCMRDPVCALVPVSIRQAHTSAPVQMDGGLWEITDRAKASICTEIHFVSRVDRKLM